MAAPQFLFVYGTLRTPVGGPAADTHYHERISGAILSRRPAQLQGALLYDFGAYPGVGPGTGLVVGELFEVTAAGLAEADVIEGHPQYYERRLQLVGVVDGESTEAWVYWAPENVLDDALVISSGDWFERERDRPLRVPLPMPDDPPLAAVMNRFADERRCWLSSVRPDDRPRAVPTAHVVHGNRIYIAVDDDDSLRTDLARNPHVVLATPEPDHAVIIEAWAIESPEMADAVASAMAAKYGNSALDRPVIVEATPLVVTVASGSEVASWDI